MPIARLPLRCPCGSGEPYAACCGPLHRGRALGDPTAPTAERLMRSRYSAFAVGDTAYLLATWHPSTSPPTLTLDEDVEWRGLEIVAATDGREDDRAGTVEFVASFWDTHERRFGQQREHSAFRRVAGQWFYVGLAD